MVVVVGDGSLGGGGVVVVVKGVVVLVGHLVVIVVVVGGVDVVVVVVVEGVSVASVEKVAALGVEPAPWCCSKCWRAHAALCLFVHVVLAYFFLGVFHCRVTNLSGRRTS